MSRILRAFFSRVLAGLVVLFPIAAAALVVSELLNLLSGVNDALATAIPGDNLGRVSIITLVSVATVLLALFLLGAFIAPRQQGQSSPLERKFLNYIPGYSIIRGLILGSFGQAGEQTPKAGVLRRFPGIEEIVVILDRLDDGRSVVFVPNAPTPSSGQLYIVENEYVQPTDSKLLDAFSVYADWGKGADKVLPPRSSSS